MKVLATQFYGWKKQLTGSAEAVFGSKNATHVAAKVDPREQQIQRLPGGDR